MNKLLDTGTLYVVGTPIGNLGDISFRARETLEKVDFIAAEDTRVSVKLLTHFNIKKPLISCHEHNIIVRSEEILQRIENGESCAVITDAGMPCISDPGEVLIRIAHERGIKIVVIPGACALISALAISGLSTSRFSFEGFLSITKKQRINHLLSIKDYPNTIIFYEAPHKLKNTLSDLLVHLGDRDISLCRELTKIHEEVIKGKISDMLNIYSEKEPRGEYVLVVSGNQQKNVIENNQISLNEAVEMALKLVDDGYKKSDASKLIAEKNNIKKSDIYKKLF